MKLLRIIGMGLRGLASKPARTALSALGIVIGVAAVVALTSLGNGIRESVSGQITDLGPNLITVSPGSEEGDEGGIIDAEMASTLTLQDARNVAALPSVRAASSVVATRALVGGESVPSWAWTPCTTRSERSNSRPVASSRAEGRSCSPRPTRSGCSAATPKRQWERPWPWAAPP